MNSAQFINRFLDSPIIRNGRDKFLSELLESRAGGDGPSQNKTRRKIALLLKAIGDDEIEALEPELYASLDQEFIPDSYRQLLIDSFQLAQVTFSRADSGARGLGLLNGLGTTLVPYDILDELTLTWYDKSRTLTEVVEVLATGRARGASGLVDKQVGNLRIIADEYIGILQVKGDSVWYLFSYEQLLMLKDMYYSRFNACLAAYQIYRDTVLVENIHRALEWFLKCVAVYGNKGYEIAKNIEALAKANLIRVADPLLGDHGSYDNMLEVVKMKERKLGKTSEFLTDELDTLLRENRPLSHAVELFGLQKLSGHPLIDPNEGGESVKEQAQKKIKYSMAKIQRVRNNWARMYIEGHVRKTGRWPTLLFPPGTRSGKLYQLYSLRELKLTKDSYDLSELTGVKFAKSHEFDYYENFTDLMDDKSISFYRDEIAATWDRQMKTRSHKRLLIEMLSREVISIKSIVDAVRQGNIPRSWLVVSLYPKEREFKTAARMFSMMVFEMRAFFACTEANLADHIFPYLPQQTMTLNRTEIQELFHKATNSTTLENWVKLYLEVDLTRWNLNFHPEAVDPIGMDLDDLFGLPGTFTAIHHFFRDCLIVVRVADCRPDGIETEDPPEGPLVMKNHEVGFEGIAQKLWSIVTYSMIDLGLTGVETKYYHIGQGDNQILLLYVDCTEKADPAAHIRSLAALLVDSIDRECTNIGQEVKPEECLQSSNVVTYSKDVYISGVEYFTSVKACSRIFPHSASDFPAIDNSIGAISGQCLAAAEKMKNPMNAFALWCLHAAHYLYFFKDFQPMEACLIMPSFRKQLKKENLFQLMILPGDLGGLPIACVTNFFYKGGADPTSKSLASLLFYQEESTSARRLLYNLHIGKWFSASPDLKLLLEDPYGLPLSRPATAESSVLRQSQEKVKAVTKNRDLGELMSASVEEYEDKLTDALITCRPFNPVLLSDIIGWSLVGSKKTVSKMFTATRTVQGLLQGSEESTVCSRILSSGTSHFLDTAWRLLKADVGEYRMDSVYKEMKHYRSFWSADRSLEIAGVTSYTPWDLKLEVSKNSLVSPGFKAFYGHDKGSDHHHTRGKEEPYIGRRTVEKRSDHGYKIVTNSAPERAVKRLADIATQPGVTPEFRRFVSKVAESRADVGLEAVYPLIGSVIGGTIAHRYASRLGLRSANGMGSMTYASSCVLSTDTAAPISGGEHDYPVMVQEMMVYTIAVGQITNSASAEIQFSNLRTDLLEWEVLDEEALSIKDDWVLPHVRLVGNPIASAAEIKLKRTSGPAMGPLVSDLTNVLSHPASHLYAVRRRIHNALMQGHSSSAIADRGAGVVPFSLDLLELRGCTITGVLKEMAKEIGCFAVEGLYKRSSEELRWTPAPVITSLAWSLASSISRYITHPMFSNDPYVARYLTPAPLRYKFGYASVVKKIRDTIAQQALQYVADPTAEMFTEHHILFSDDTDLSVSSTVIRVYTLIAFQGSLIGEITYSDANKFVRTNLIRTLNGKEDEDSKLQALSDLIVVMEAWAVRAGKPILAEQYRSLLSKTRVRRVSSSGAEILRNARSLSPVKPPPAVPDEKTRVTPVDVVRILALVPQPGTMTAFYGMLGPSPSSYTDYEKFTTLRLVGRLFGMDSSVGYTYNVLGSILTGRIPLIIGCGYGTGAAVCFRQGSPMVYGLDLWEDLDPKSLMEDRTVPPAVVSLQGNRNFIRVPVTQERNGDLRNAATAEILSSFLSVGTLVIIDIPVRDRQGIIQCLATLSLSQITLEILWRFIGPISEWVSFLATVIGIDRETKSYAVSTAFNHIEAWIHFRLPPTYHLVGRICKITSPTLLVSSQVGHLRYLGGGKDYLTSIIEGPYKGLTRDDMSRGVISIENMVRVSVGEKDHRFSYDQWTEMLLIILCREVLTAANPLALIFKILESETWTVSAFERELTVNINTRALRLLTRVVPRLLNPSCIAVYLRRTTP